MRSKIYVDKTGLPNELLGKDWAAAVGLASYSARKNYKLIREFPTGRGFADIVSFPLPHTKSPAIVIELKYDKTADTAIAQIKEKHYTQALEGYSGEIVLVGINYQKESKSHSCVIERINKEND